jgi:very-short-patch-repair endonuclease
VKSRHVDFLVVDRNWYPQMVVEVDGSSHERPDRRTRDERVSGRRFVR